MPKMHKLFKKMLVYLVIFLLTTVSLIEGQGRPPPGARGPDGTTVKTQDEHVEQQRGTEESPPPSTTPPPPPPVEQHQPPLKEEDFVLLNNDPEGGRHETEKEVIEPPLVEEMVMIVSDEGPTPPPSMEEEERKEPIDISKLSPEMQKAHEYFNAASSLLKKSRQAGRDLMMKQAYRMLDEAANLGHKESKELIAYAYMFGDFMPWNVRKARNLFEELSNGGSAGAQTGLAFLNAAGIGQNSSQAKALVYFTFAALGGDPLAQMALGYRYWSGINVQSNCESALTWYKKVATKVSDEVKHAGSFAVQRIRLPDEMESPTSSSQFSLMDDNLLQYYRFLADKGDLQAQIGLGQLFLTGGRGVEQNFELAHHYFGEAAEAGSANAYAYLGKMYLDGNSATPQNNQTAYQFFKRAADKGNAVGQSGLGLMYLYGRGGVEKDYSRAMKYFQSAAEQGWVDGQLNLGHMYFNGLGVRRDYKAAIKYFQLASQGGHVLAFFNLAQMHATGVGISRNCHTAVELYKNVAERGRWAEKVMEAYTSYKEGLVDQAALKYLFMAELGYEVAQTNVAYLLDRGDVSMFDGGEVCQRSLLHWGRAANQGYAMARVKLGDYFYYGWGTKIDYETAASHYKVASDQQHNAQAMFNLGYMHEQGMGIKKDIHLAKRFYDMAAETSSDAHVPVYFALLKLSGLFALESFREQPLMQLLSLERYFGADWDIYAISLLCGLLALLVYCRRR